MKKSFDPHEITSLRVLHDHVVVEEMAFDSRTTSGGIIVLNDDKKVEGVRPRWAKVYAVGAEQHDVEVGQWVLVEHGRWTRGVKVKDSNGEHTIRRVDNNAILAVSDEQVIDDTMGRPL